MNIYILLYSVFRCLNEGVLIADFYRQNKTRGLRILVTLSRLIKRASEKVREGKSQPLFSAFMCSIVSVVVV